MQQGSSPSLTSHVFGNPRPGYYFIYYTVRKSQEVENLLAPCRQYVVVLMFFANWNQLSMVMMKPFRDLAMAKQRVAVFCRLNADMFKDYLRRYQVEALPTLLLIKEGVEMVRVVGAKVDELNTIIKANI